jgi:fibronectin type 3 domain-containing protein
MALRLSPWVCALGLALAAGLPPARANIPGGGTGTGANVTLVNNNNGTVTMSNGILSILVTTAGATVNQINYTFNNTGSNQTLQILSGGKNGGQLYWETGGFGTGSFAYSVIVDPAVGDAKHAKGDYAEIDLFLNSATNGTMDVHFSMLRGSSGFYVTPIWSHRAADVAMGTGEERDNIYYAPYFNWRSTSYTHDKEEGIGQVEVPAAFSPQENALVTTGINAGTYDDKYKYSEDFGTERVWGWSSVSNSTIGVTGKNIGLWYCLGSSEYFNGGPLKPELMDAPMVIMTNGGHYLMGSDSNFGAGEVWTRVSGPYFVYVNNISATITNPIQASRALFADANAQAAAEISAWPYAWFVNGNYTPAAGRGNVTGRIVINDPYNPYASSAGLWVGVVQQPVTIDGVYDFQQWMKPYQFWVKGDANGNFTIPNVIAGANYTLYAFGPGAAGTFMSQNQSGGNPPVLYNLPAAPFAVVDPGGNTTVLGNVTWTPARVGPTVWEIGYPDRKSDKFRHGDDWWLGDIGPSPSQPSPVWTKFLEYPFDFPNGVKYMVGQSRWSTDWNFIQPIVEDSLGNSNPTNSTITFTLASAPAANATASLYIGTCSDDAGPLIVTVNGHVLVSGSGNVTATPSALPSTGYFPSYSSSDTSIREENHAPFSDERIGFPASLLVAGNNTINLNMRKGGYFANHAMYDYLRLEMPGYVPPAPAGVAVYPGNNCNLVSWPAVPGATSYNLLRSLTVVGNYTILAANVTGPVCGSGPANATFVDNTAANGTPYFYSVQSVNPVGASANSPASAGTAPSSGAATTAPAAPTGLMVAAVGNATVNLSWPVVPGASYYTLYRGTVVNLIGFIPSNIVLSNTITGNTYTDTSPTNGSQYAYFITATNAFGTSANSSSVVAKPVPAAPSTAPGSLTVNTAAGGNGTSTLSWTGTPGAVGYIIQRSTSASGPFTFVQTVTTLTYTDSGLSNNTAYYYTITAVNAAGVSGNSTVTSGVTAPNPPVITGVASTGNVTLSWSAVSGAANYTIQRSTSTGNETTITTGITNTTYTNTGLTNNLTYFYVVDAVNANGATSADSNEVSATPLAQAANVTASTGTANVTLAWGNVTGAATYSVFRGTVNGGPYATAVATNIAANTTVNTGLTNGTTYYYVVSAANTTTKGLGSNTTAIAATPLAAPANFTATAGTGAVTLAWSNTTGATAYTVRRGNVTGGPYATVAANVSINNYTDSGLVNGTAYFYVVAALAANSLSANSTEATATPLGVPGSLAATPGYGNIALAWSAAAGAANYTVQRSLTSGSGFATIASGVSTTNYTDPAAATGQTYYYRILAANAGGAGSPSAQLATTTIPPPAAPANLAATPGDATVVLTWSAPANATTFVVSRSLTTGGNYATIASGISSSNYTDANLTNGQTYYYVAAATNPSGTGPNSLEASATPAQTLNQWTAAAFPGVTDANITGPAATPDGDGVPNILKYFYGLSPGVSANTTTAPANTTTDNSNHILFTFRLGKNLTGVIYSIQSSPDLLTWTDTGVTATVLSDQGAYYLMQAAIPLGSAPSLYLRLKITTP